MASGSPESHRDIGISVLTLANHAITMIELLTQHTQLQGNVFSGTHEIEQICEDTHTHAHTHARTHTHTHTHTHTYTYVLNITTPVLSQYYHFLLLFFSHYAYFRNLLV